MFLRILAVALAGAVLLAACGSDSDGSSDSDDASESADSGESDDSSDSSESGESATACPSEAEAAATAEDLSSKPLVAVPASEPPTELEVIDLVEGDGAEAVAGDMVFAHYVGVLHEDCTEFDSSWERGQPFEFQLGVGGVIAGWDEGIEGMKVGGRRMLVIPSELAYGESGGGDVIGPGAALVFVVDLVDVLTLPDPSEEPTLEIPEEFSGELEIVDLVEGDGAELAEGDLATMHYVLGLESSGEVAESSWGAGPVTYPVGASEGIEGWNVGLLGMKEGGRRLLVVPPELAFGEDGNGPIPPNDTLIFVVDLLKVN